MDWKRMVIFFTTSVVLMLLFSLFEIKDFIQLSRNLGFLGITAIIFVSFLRPILGGIRCSFVYRPLGHISITDASKGYILSAYGSIFLPSTIGGDLLRIEHMKNCTGETRKIALSVAATERIFGFFTLLFLALLISFFDDSTSKYNSTLIYVSLLILLIVSLSWLYLTKSKPDSLLYSTYIYIKGLSKKLSIFVIFILSLIFQCVSLSVPVIVAYIIADYQTALYIALMTPVIAIFSTIPITVGGIGIREGGYLGLGAVAGIDSEVSLLAGLALSVSIVVSGLPAIFFQNEIFLTKQETE
ncbi:MAG: hypothetical protein CMB51_07135 [Euryarchaeota archaeon]|nr:hypothetical protein [Euryarchaeota archaeon]DAC18985.1 MAG TPA: UPF0104 family protein [Candidatus Poseidoniales archaeon]HII62142.1 flippase-like domain-containing protein [Candidatus Poseidoniaceae archaeon]|tara:strand:+ start:5565 stop:6464 length:900 start_codon:yes stop_codon:yes gene_type:complete